jgi:hypothetical protein
MPPRYRKAAARPTPMTLPDPYVLNIDAIPDARGGYIASYSVTRSSGEVACQGQLHYPLEHYSTALLTAYEAACVAIELLKHGADDRVERGSPRLEVGADAAAAVAVMPPPSHTVEEGAVRTIH